MNRRIALLISLAANGVLVSFIYLTVQQRQLPAAPATPKWIVHYVTNEFRVTKRLPRPPGARVAELKFHWSMIESEKYPAYIENLRAIGCPEKTIRDIVLADIEKLYGGRRRALQASGSDDFWRTHSQREPQEQARARRFQELESEKRALVHGLLGLDLETQAAPWDNPEADDEELLAAFLSPEKQRTVQGIQRRSLNAIRAIQQSPDGIVTSEDEERAGTIFRRMESDIGRALTPAESEEFWLRATAVSDLNLVAFTGSEREYRALAQLQKEFNFTHADPDRDSAAGLAALPEADPTFEDQVGALLGAEGLAAFNRSRDLEFHRLFFVAEENQVPIPSVIRAYDLHQASVSELDRIRQNLGLSAEERQLAVEDVRRRTEAALGRALGAGAYQTYLRSISASIENPEASP